MWVDGYEDAFNGRGFASCDKDYTHGYQAGLHMKEWNQGYEDFVRGLAPQKDTDIYISGYEEAFDDSQEDIGEQDELL